MSISTNTVPRMLTNITFFSLYIKNYTSNVQMFYCYFYNNYNFTILEDCFYSILKEAVATLTPAFRISKAYNFFVPQIHLPKQSLKKIKKENLCSCNIWPQLYACIHTCHISSANMDQMGRKCPAFLGHQMPRKVLTPEDH